MENYSDTQINELFSFIYGWHNVNTEKQRQLIIRFLVDEAITLKDVFTEIENF